MTRCSGAHVGARNSGPMSIQVYTMTDQPTTSDGRVIPLHEGWEWSKGIGECCWLQSCEAHWYVADHEAASMWASVACYVANNPTMHGILDALAAAGLAPDGWRPVDELARLKADMPPGLDFGYAYGFTNTLAVLGSGGDARLLIFPSGSWAVEASDDTLEVWDAPALPWLGRLADAVSRYGADRVVEALR